jgi:hypothetical protein
VREGDVAQPFDGPDLPDGLADQRKHAPRTGVKCPDRDWT